MSPIETPGGNPVAVVTDPAVVAVMAARAKKAGYGDNVSAYATDRLRAYLRIK